MRDLPFDNRAQAAYMVQENRFCNKFRRRLFAFFNMALPEKKIILKGEFKSDGKFHLTQPLKLMANRKYILVFPFPITNQKYEDMKWDITTSKQGTIDIIIDEK